MNAKLYELIGERRATDGAAVIYEYQHPQGNSWRAEAAAIENNPDPHLIPPDRLADLREFVQRVTNECEERLSREMTLLCKIQEHDGETTLTGVGFVTKCEAAEISGWPGTGEILDLDVVSGGFMIRRGHLFISESRVAQGLDKYGLGEDLLTGIINDRLAEVRRESELACQ